MFVNKHSNLTVNNCIFHNNKANNSNGGAIRGEEATIIEINNSEFSDNVASRVTNLSWQQFKSGMGSAICVFIDSQLKLYNSIFKGNYAYCTTVLVISYSDYDDINKTSSLLVKNCTFENNTSIGCGVIYLDELSVGEIIDSIFRGNSHLYYGGTIILDIAFSALVKDCIFENNLATNGGGIYIGVFSRIYRSYVDIIGCNFTNNTARVDGGAIHSRYGVTNVINCSFDSNVAGETGGAIGASKGTIKISDSKCK